MNIDQAKALIRALILSVGAILVKKGITDESGLEDIAGAIATIAPIIWSIVEKRSSATLTKAIDHVNDAVANGDVKVLAPATAAPVLVKTP